MNLIEHDYANKHNTVNFVEDLSDGSCLVECPKCGCFYSTTHNECPECSWPCIYPGWAEW